MRGTRGVSEQGVMARLVSFRLSETSPLAGSASTRFFGGWEVRMGDIGEFFERWVIINIKIPGEF